MTPKEKAIEIYTKMYNEVYASYGTDFLAKQCALIAVNQLVDEIISFDSQMSEARLFDKDLKYWLEVKKEIEKL
jgi:hypothetical protein